MRLRFVLGRLKNLGINGLTIREQELFQENEYLFEMAANQDMKCISLTATSYESLEQESVFAYL